MSFKPMLASAIDLTRLDWSHSWIVSPKLDGIRASIVNGVAKTRSLKDIPNRHVSAALSLAALTGLDGELIVGSPTSKSVYRDTVSEVMSHDKEPVFTYYVFDVHDHPGGYEERCAELIRRVRAHNLGFITVLQSAEVKSEAELLAYEVEMIHLGYEGVIVRKPDAPYKYGRSTVNEAYLLKMKSFEDSEAEIIGFSEEQENGNDAQTNELGRTKRSTAKAGLSGKQTLGAFQVRDKVSGVEFSVGTGLTAAERQRYWDGRDSLVGALIKYKFFPVGVKVAPRHPVFLGFRDKSDL